MSFLTTRPGGAPLPHPARPGHAALGRSPPCARALRRGCRTALEARQSPQAVGWPEALGGTLWRWQHQKAV